MPPFFRRFPDVRPINEIANLNTAPEAVPSCNPARVSLALQVVGTMVAVVVFALGLAALLNALRFQETLRDLVEKRLDIVVQEVASNIQVGIDLGLRIEAMDNLAAIVEREAQQAEGVAAITIHDCAGNTLASARSAAPGDTIDGGSPWLSHLGKSRWRRFDDQGIALGIILKNSYGTCAGGVAVAYEAGTFFQTRDAVVERIRRIALVAALLTLPAAILLGLMFRRRSRMLHRLRTDLDALSAGRAALVSPLADPAWQKSGERDLIGAYNNARPVLIEASDQIPSAATGQELVSSPDERQGLFSVVSRWFANPVVRVLVLTSATLILALTLVSWFAAHALKESLLPEMAHKGMAEASQAGRTVQRALDLDIPLEALVGVDGLFTGLQRNDSNLAFLTLTDADGNILHTAGMSEADVRTILLSPAETVANMPTAVQSRRAEFLVSSVDLKDRDGRARGTFHLGHQVSALIRPLQESIADVAIVLLVSLFLAFELMLFVVTVNITLPVRATLRVLRDVAARRFALIHGEFGGDEMGAIARRLNVMVLQGAARLGITPHVIQEPRLVGVRLLAFLFVFAEEMARPIMPAFFGQLTAGAEGTISHLGAGSVMALHMAVIAVAMPIGSMLYARIGRRHMYIAGALLASAGLLGTGLADSLWQLLLWRAVSAIGYAATFVACQGFVIESTSNLDRTRGTAMMVGGIMLADICGPAIGGIIAAWLGAGVTFMLGAAIAFFAAIQVPFLMGRLTDHHEDPPKITFTALTNTLANRRFLTLMAFAAIPAKMTLSGLLFYLVPLALIEFGANLAQVGHTIMLYGLAGLLTGSLFARVTDHFQRPVVGLAIGGLITAAGAIPLFGASSATTVTFAVVALGIGQSLSIPALVAAALALSQPAVAAYGQGPVMAVLRLLERLGGATGPLLAAVLSASYGIGVAMGLFGFYSLVSALLLLLVMHFSDRRRHRRPPKPPASNVELP